MAEMASSSSGALPPEPAERVRTCLRLLSDPAVRLLSLIGSPGIGKTWLAEEVVDALRAQPAREVLKLPFAEVDNWLLFWPNLAESLGLNQQQTLWKLQEEVIAELRAKNFFLFLDAFETVLPAATSLSKVLSECPGVKMVVTSRQTLELAEEHPVQVPPLPLPEDLGNEGSCAELFNAYLHSLTSSFNTEEATRLCRHLEGLPLAILAAARQTGERGFDAVLADLETAAYLKTWSLPSSRFATLYDVVAWSYAQLSEEAQTLLKVASLFDSFEPAELLPLLADFDGVLTEIEANLENLKRLELLKAAPGSVKTLRLNSMLRDFLRLHLSQTGELAQLEQKLDVQGATSPTSRPTYVPETAVQDEKNLPSTSFDVDGDFDDLSLIEPLTERELDVLVFVVRGLSNREVAGELGISHRTVSTHLSNIYGKLNVRTRTAAALRAQQLGLIEPLQI